MIISPFSSVITLNDLRLNINLGLYEEERNAPQEVRISFKLFFKDAPKACNNDDIQDTVCYFTISEAIKAYCSDKEFKLIEYLAKELHGEIKKITPPMVKIWVMVEKHPPIKKLAGSAAFEYTE